jgi:Uma2 family endonuclease
MAINAKKLTFTDYEKIPEDGFRHEIIEGEEFMTPAPEVPHQRVSAKLVRILQEHLGQSKAGEVLFAPVDVVLSQEDIVQPDIIIIASDHANRVTQKNIQGAPDLVIEILSPSTAPVDRGRKLALYDRAGVREYWIVDPAAKTAEVHEFGSPRRRRAYQEGQSFESAIFPGLTVRLTDIF